VESRPLANILIRISVILYSPEDMELNQYTGKAVQMALTADPLTSNMITSRLLPVTSLPYTVDSKAHY
jgi:hypothetical protein